MSRPDSIFNHISSKHCKICHKQRKQNLKPHNHDTEEHKCSVCHGRGHSKWKCEWNRFPRAVLIYTEHRRHAYYQARFKEEYDEYKYYTDGVDYWYIRKKYSGGTEMKEWYDKSIISKKELENILFDLDGKLDIKSFLVQNSLDEYKQIANEIHIFEAARNNLDMFLISDLSNIIEKYMFDLSFFKDLTYTTNTTYSGN